MWKTAVLLAAALAPAPAQSVPPGLAAYQPAFRELRAYLALSDAQLAQLRQLQQDRVQAVQAGYQKMVDQQRQLDALLAAPAPDPAAVGSLMLELQALRRNVPGPASVTEQAAALLTAEQRAKLAPLRDALRLRQAVEQALMLHLIDAPPAAPAPLTTRAGQ